MKKVYAWVIKKHRVAPFDNIYYSIKSKSSVKFNFNKKQEQKQPASVLKN